MDRDELAETVRNLERMAERNASEDLDFEEAKGIVPEFDDVLEGFEDLLEHREAAIRAQYGLVREFEAEYGVELSEDGQEMLDLIVRAHKAAADGFVS